MLQEAQRMASHYRGVFETLYEPYEGDDAMIIRAKVAREMLGALEVSCKKLRRKGRKYRKVVTIDVDKILPLLNLDPTEVLAIVKLRDLREIFEKYKEIEIPLFTPRGEVLVMIERKPYVLKHYEDILEIIDKIKSHEDLYRVLIETPLGSVIKLIEKLFGVFQLFAKAEEITPSESRDSQATLAMPENTKYMFYIFLGFLIWLLNYTTKTLSNYPNTSRMQNPS